MLKGQHEETSVNKRDISRIYVSSVMTGLPMGFNYVAFPIYLSMIGYSSLQIGLVIAVGGIMGSVFMVPLGILSDRFGRKRFIIIARALSALSYLILFSTSQLSLIYLFSILNGLAFASVGSSFSALLSDKTDLENRNYVFSTNYFLSGTSQAAGMVLSNFPSILILNGYSIFFSFRLLFALFIAIQITSLFIFVLISEDFVPRERVRVSKETMKTVWKLGFTGMIGLGAGMLVRLFSLWFYLRFSLDIATIGNFFAISQVLTSIGYLFSARIAARAGTVKTIVITEALAVVMLLLLPLSFSPLMAIVIYISRSVLMNMTFPIMNSFTMGIIRSGERATASSIIQLFDSGPRSFGPAIGGYFYNIGQLETPFYITAILYTISIGFFFGLFRNVKAQK